MGSLRRRVGFWNALGRQNLRSVAGLETLTALAVGISGSVWLLHVGNLEDRTILVNSYVGLAGALLGIVFAALALVVALFTTEYLRFLDEDGSGDGVIEFLSPFMIAIGLQIGVLLGAVAYGAGASHIPDKVEAWWFGTVTTLFLIAALDVIALARSVVMHGVARAKLKTLAVTDIDERRAEQRRKSGSA